MIKKFLLVIVFLHFLLPFCWGQELFISEVYIDGTDEWVEIANVGTGDFHGTIVLEGVKSSPLSLVVEIPLEGTLLLGDKMEMVTIPIPTIKDLGFSLSDTKTLHITLSIDGLLINTFEATQSLVEEINNTKTSLEKECIQGACTYNPSSITDGVIEGYMASPGTYIFIPEEIDDEGDPTLTGTGIVVGTGQTMTGSITIGTGSLGSGSILTGGIDNGTGDQQITTGSTITGETTIGSGDSGTGNNSEEENPPPPLPEVFEWGDIRIIEVHENDTDVLKEYIIIESMIEYTGPLRFSGLGQGEAEKISNVSLSPGDRLIITDSTENISSSEKWYTFPSITLSNGGETLFMYIDDILIDVIHYEGSEKGQVTIYTDTRDGIREFETHTSSSVLLENSIEPLCTITVDALGMDENNQVIYNLSLVDIDLVYCSSRYTSEWIINNEVHHGCSVTTTLSGGQHFISTTIYNQTTPLCSSFTTIYNHLPLSEGTGDVEEENEGAIVTIEEIYPRDTEAFSEYVEFLALQDYIGSITIGGLGHGGASKVITISVGKGERFIVTDGTGALSKDTKTYILPSISLTNSGEELVIYRQDGQEVDMVVYPEGIEGKSLYYTTTSGSIHTFLTSDIPTPGFTYDQIRFLLETNKEDLITNCAIKLQHTTPLFLGNKINLISQVGEKEIQNSSKKYTCVWDFEGSSYIFDGGCNPTYYDYGEGGIYTVGLRITDTSTNKTCQTSLDINYPPKSSPSGGSSSGGDTYYQGLYKKRKGRFETLKKETKSLGYSVSTSGYITTQTSLASVGEILSGVISIEKVLPNPSGSDTDAEKLILRNLSDEDILLVDYKIYNGTSRKKLPEVLLLAHEDTVLVGSLGLTNRATCIQLQHDDITYDIFCYPKAEDDQWFDTSLDISTDDTSLLTSFKNIKLTLEKDQACIVFQKNSILCKGLKYHDDDVKQWKKDAKKYTTVLKKVDKETQRANNWRSKYSDQVAKRKRDTKKLQGRITKEKATVGWYRKQNIIHSSFANLIVEELQTNWSPIFYGSNLADYTDTYRDIIKRVKKNTYTYNYHGLSLPIENVEDILILQEGGELPLVDTDLSEVYNKVIEQTQGTLASFNQNLKNH